MTDQNYVPVIEKQEDIKDNADRLLSGDFNTMVIKRHLLPHYGIDGDVEADKQALQNLTQSAVFISTVKDNYIITRPNLIERPPVVH